MTKLLDRAIERLKALPSDRQDDLARILLRLSDEDGATYQLTTDEEADLTEAEAEVARGELATDEMVKAIWTKHRL